MLILTHVSGKSTFFSRDELWFPSAINHFPLENGVGGLETLLLSLREDDLARWRPAMALASAGPHAAKPRGELWDGSVGSHGDRPL